MNPKTINLLTNRKPDTYKWDYGHALLIAGSHGRMGCAVLAARACMRTGAGLLTVHVPERAVDILQISTPEAMLDIDPSPTLFTALPDNLDRYDAIAVGPGIGTHASTALALQALLTALAEKPKPLILDADALNLAALYPGILPSLPQGTVVTPHAGEYQRLFGDADPADMAREHGIVIVKKSHRTQIFTPDGEVTTNTTGNAGMATAGSGDVLTGILLGLAAQGVEPAEAAKIGVWMHGKSGDIAMQKQSQSSIIASDLVENLKYIPFA